MKGILDKIIVLVVTSLLLVEDLIEFTCKNIYKQVD
jgi:hypothetical protein